jgi:hypothetical protein
VLDGRSKHGACLVNAVAGVQQPLDVLIVFRPLLDLEEVALVGVVGVGGRFRRKAMSCAIAAGCGLAGASQSHGMLRVAREGRGQALWKSRGARRIRRAHDSIPILLGLPLHRRRGRVLDSLKGSLAMEGRRRAAGLAPFGG